MKKSELALGNLGLSADQISGIDKAFSNVIISMTGAGIKNATPKESEVSEEGEKDEEEGIGEKLKPDMLKKGEKELANLGTEIQNYVKDSMGGAAATVLKIFGL